MSHDTHTSDSSIKELELFGGDRKKLLSLVDDWEDPFPKPEVREHDLGGVKVKVVRDDLFGFGTKIRAGSAVLHQPEYRRAKTIVYVAPRVGWAPLSLAYLCKTQKRRLVLFCPAAKELSHHQRCAYELGAELRFVRIAAMPVLQGIAKRWAEDRGAAFFPLGLAVPAAVAGLAKVATGLGLRPKQVWCAMSTGVLGRALQIAWPSAEHHAVAVARNIQKGEKGTAIIHSHPFPFLKDAPKGELPPYPTAASYDGKINRFAAHEAKPGAVIWNVAGSEVPGVDRWSKPVPVSFREWGDDSDVNKS